MYSLKKGHIQTWEITLNSFLQELCTFLDLKFLRKFVFLNSMSVGALINYVTLLGIIQQGDALGPCSQSTDHFSHAM